MSKPSEEAPEKRPEAPNFGRRISIGFAAAVLLIAITGLVSYSVLHQTASSGHAFARQARAVMEFGRLRRAIEQKTIAAREFLITGDEKFLPQIDQRHKELQAQIRKLRKADLSKKERELLARIDAAEQAHQRATEEAIALRRGGERAGYFAESVEPARESLERGLSAYLFHERQVLEQADTESAEKIPIATSLILVSGILSIGLTILLAVLLTRRLVRLYETERREGHVAETARQRYRDLVEGIPGGFVWEADAATLRMTFVSRRAESMLGYPREESRSRPDFWMRLIPPEDREGVLATIARALTEGKGHSVEHRCVTADGKMLWFQSRVRLVKDEKEGTSVLRGLSVDITRLKEVDAALRASEARKGAVLNSALDAIITIDQSGRVLEFNPAAEQMFGYTEAEAIGREMADLIVPTRLRENHRKGLARTVETGEGAILNRRLEMPALRADGAEFPVELSIARIADADPPVFTGFVRDITERERSEKERAALLKDAREAIRARDEFLSIASHELKTPLTTLQLQVQGVARRIQTAPDLAALQKVVPRLSTAERQIDRLTSLINSLLDISRITVGRLELDRERMDLCLVVREVVGRFQEELARAECSVEVHCDGPSTGVWDRLRVEQIVVNLLSNAAKYGAGHPIEVEVGGDPETARLVIRDHGIGIPPEDQSRIFERFERAVSDRHYGGLGLGLWIVRQVVDALGGRIEVESLPGIGSTFLVLLPREPAASDESASEGRTLPS